MRQRMLHLNPYCYVFIACLLPVTMFILFATHRIDRRSIDAHVLFVPCAREIEGAILLIYYERLYLW